MGEMADYYLEQSLFAPIEDEEQDPVWVTRDKRVIPIRDMEDSHLANTINFLRARGARLPEEVKKDPLAAAEFAMSRYGKELQKKLQQLTTEKKRREKLSAPDRAQPAAR